MRRTRCASSVIQWRSSSPRAVISPRTAASWWTPSIGAKLEHAELVNEAARLRLAPIDGMRAELAAALVLGTPCPVCGSLDHPELCELQGERVTREQEEDADAEAAAAGERTETIGAKLGAAVERVNDLTARLQAAGFVVAADQTSLAADAKTLAAMPVVEECVSTR